jgi:hypothetical protein
MICTDLCQLPSTQLNAAKPPWLATAKPTYRGALSSPIVATTLAPIIISLAIQREIASRLAAPRGMAEARALAADYLAPQASRQ